MALAAQSLAKERVFHRVFEDIPDVLIQDPARGCAYHIPRDRLESFTAGPDIWAKVGPGTVTFAIPSGDVLEDVPPFMQNADIEPSVLIQFPKQQKSFFLEYAELVSFKIPQPDRYPDGFEGISFVIPRGLEFIEQLPAVRRATLQSGT